MNKIPKHEGDNFILANCRPLILMTVSISPLRVFGNKRFDNMDDIHQKKVYDWLVPKVLEYIQRRYNATVNAEIHYELDTSRKLHIHVVIGGDDLDGLKGYDMPCRNISKYVHKLVGIQKSRVRYNIVCNTQWVVNDVNHYLNEVKGVNYFPCKTIHIDKIRTIMDYLLTPQCTPS